jgi:hypothetical protein
VRPPPSVRRLTSMQWERPRPRTPSPRRSTARLSLEGIAAFEVQRISGAVDGSATTYEVQLRVWFTLLERMHG